MTPTFLDLFDALPADAPAIGDGQRCVSHGEFQDLARRAAAHLAAAHGSGGYLLVRAASTVEFVVTFFAVMYSGNTPVPVDPGLPQSAIDYMSEKAHARAVIDPIDLDALDGVAPLDARRADMPTLIMFTSGTTGFPKGVIISHENLRHSCGAMASYLEYRQWPSAAVVLPLHYSYALLSQVCAQLSIGGYVRLIGDVKNPLALEKVMNEEGLQTFCGVPSTYLAFGIFNRLRALRMPSVRVICSAGAALDAATYATAKEIFPNATFFNNYGMTEAAPRIAWIRDDDPRFRDGTCGRAMNGLEIRIVDPDTLQPVAPGGHGVLTVRGRNVTSGYLNDPDLTSKAFTPEGFLISGDIAHMEGDYIFIHGRSDDIFNCGGEKVAPIEIERALDSHDGVEKAFVAGVPDPQRGMVPVAFVKLREPLSKSALTAHLQPRLSRNKIPQRFIQVRAFPMTNNGKVQRKRLSADDPEHVLGEVR